MIRKGLTFDDVLLTPTYNDIDSRKDVSTKVKLGSHEEQTYFLDIPICSANMDTITGTEMARAIASRGGLPILHRFCSIEDNVSMYLESLKNDASSTTIGVSVGVNRESIDRANALFEAGAEVFCVDVAHGHSKNMGKMIQYLRGRYKDNILIIAGNVSTEAAATYLACQGADVLKIGQGSGSACQTRITAGIGVPQLTAIMDCARVDRQLIADGGIRTPGDAVKALAAGADMVMLGGMLAGTTETPGEITQVDGREYKRFRGMASQEAQEVFMGGMPEWKTAEGVAVDVTYKGSANHVLDNVLGGIRSGMTYLGASTLEELRNKAVFMEVTGAGVKEGTPHIKGRS